MIYQVLIHIYLSVMHLKLLTHEKAAQKNIHFITKQEIQK